MITSGHNQGAADDAGTIQQTCSVIVLNINCRLQSTKSATLHIAAYFTGEHFHIQLLFHQIPDVELT